jgi:hypothetical protein
MLIHGNVRVEEAHGKFTDKGSDVDMTRLESGMSFLQVKASMRMREKLMQIRSSKCINRQDAHSRLEAVAWSR